MKLADYLTANQLSEADFAGRAGISREMVNRLKNGQIWLSSETAERIYRATDGEVTPNDFLAARMGDQQKPDLNVTGEAA